MRTCVCSWRSRCPSSIVVRMAHVFCAEGYQILRKSCCMGWQAYLCQVCSAMASAFLAIAIASTPVGTSGTPTCSFVSPPSRWPASRRAHGSRTEAGLLACKVHKLWQAATFCKHSIVKRPLGDAEGAPVSFFVNSLGLLNSFCQNSSWNTPFLGDSIV